MQSGFLWFVAGQRTLRAHTQGGLEGRVSKDTRHYRDGTEVAENTDMELSVAHDVRHDEYEQGDLRSLARRNTPHKGNARSKPTSGTGYIGRKVKTHS
eukprot:scaffold4680_cov164-Skeletonema_marinoi.AAC.7